MKRSNKIFIIIEQINGLHLHTNVQGRLGSNGSIKLATLQHSNRQFRSNNLRKQQSAQFEPFIPKISTLYSWHTLEGTERQK